VLARIAAMAMTATAIRASTAGLYGVRDERRPG